MENRTDILKELESLSPAVAQINRENTYSVPGNYFTGFAEATLLLVKPDPEFEMPVSEVFSVPADFFTGFADSVMDRIRKQESAEEEIGMISPLLAGIKNKKTFTVPKNYFDSLQPVPEVKETARVIQMKPNRSWMRAAVAASIMAVIGLSAYFSYSPGNAIADATPPASVNTTSVENNIADLSAEEISSYLGASNAELTSFINDPEPDVEAMMRNLNEQEIKEYLKENSTSEVKPQKEI